MTGCICHQSSHTCQLFDLFIRTTGTGVSHHEDVVVLIQSVQQLSGQNIIGFFPGLYNFFVTFFFCDQTTFVVLCDVVYSLLSLLDQFRFFRRNGHIGNGYGHSCSCGEFISCCFDIIQHFCCLGSSVCIDNFFQDLFQLFLSYMEIYFQLHFVFRNASVYKAQILRQDLVEQETSQCRLYRTGLCCTVRHGLCHTHFDSGLQSQCFVFISKDCFVHALEVLAFSDRTRSFLCQVVNTKNHIL